MIRIATTSIATQMPHMELGRHRAIFCYVHGFARSHRRPYPINPNPYTSAQAGRYPKKTMTQIPASVYLRHLCRYTINVSLINYLCRHRYSIVLLCGCATLCGAMLQRGYVRQPAPIRSYAAIGAGLLFPSVVSRFRLLIASDTSVASILLTDRFSESANRRTSARTGAGMTSWNRSRPPFGPRRFLSSITRSYLLELPYTKYSR